MNALTAFLEMGGYGGYVWSAFAVAFVVLAANVFWAWRCRHKALREVADDGE